MQRTLRPTARPARRLVTDALGVGALWTSFVVAPTYWHDNPLVRPSGVTPRRRHPSPEISWQGCVSGC